uniref:Uncharacterized protein n=1 Tax=viral metagenome TaxID=1070528 RepID=A0A6C0JDW9_9ZZZZ
MTASITFSTCWYVFKAKFDPSVYQQWFDNMLSNVNNYNLVVYCDSDSYKHLEKYNGNKRIVFVFKPYTKFYNYKYLVKWMHNHEKNDLLKDRTDWKLNMLWSEKVHFVHETMTKKFFDTEYYGWCDIGYFRGRSNDMTKESLVNWPNPKKIYGLDPDKIYYACINNNKDYVKMLAYIINEKNSDGLPSMPIPPHQLSIAGGFFIAHKDKVEWWRDTYDRKLALYFEKDYLVKDDQIIVADCVFSDLENFVLCKEDDPPYDNWFMFQRLLL